VGVGVGLLISHDGGSGRVGVGVGGSVGGGGHCGDGVWVCRVQ
jgi:hypothetical protein